MRQHVARCQTRPARQSHLSATAGPTNGIGDQRRACSRLLINRLARDLLYRIVSTGLVSASSARHAATTRTSTPHDCEHSCEGTGVARQRVQTPNDPKITCAMTSKQTVSSAELTRSFQITGSVSCTPAGYRGSRDRGAISGKREPR
jgi:hypothetical protein